jgi:hypothetical protein
MDLRTAHKESTTEMGTHGNGAAQVDVEHEVAAMR